MVYCMSCFVFQILSKINNSEALLHVHSGNTFDPAWNSSREKTNLQSALIAHVFDALQDAVNILFETKLKHLICFIQDYSLDVGEVNILSLNVIKDSSCGSYKNVYTRFQLSNLVIDVNSSIDSHKSELIFMVLQFFKLSGDLDCQLTSWGKDNS